MRLINLAGWLSVSLLLAVRAAHAIGLGEINIHSGLGQPLRASIMLLGEKNFSADCIKLQPSSNNALPMPPTLKFELKETVGKSPKLLLSTRQAMHEPALGITVILQCDGRLQREYAILLDFTPPAPREETAPSLPALVTSSTSGISTPAENALRPPASAAPKRWRALPLATTDKKTVPTTPKSKRATLPQPRLTLSGSRLLRVDTELGLPLRLDLSLPDLARIPDKPLSESERLDDNTALTHKLAHLEQQLATLQKHNEALNRQTRLQASQLHAAQKQNTLSLWRALPQWIWLLAGALLFSSAVAWLLYRHRQGQGQDTLFEDDYVIISPPQQDSLLAQNAKPVSTAQSPFDPVPEAQAPRHEWHFEQIPSKAVPQETKKTTSDENDDLGDWTDAYMTHSDAELHDKLDDIVEVCLAQDNPEMAIQLLAQSIRQSPQESPASWLALLDLLQKSGDMARYNQTLGKFQQLFNISIPNPDQIQLAQGRTGIEAYPHVLSELLHLWPAGDITSYLDALLRDTRGGTRTGFDIETYHEINLLLSILRTEARP